MQAQTQTPSDIFFKNFKGRPYKLRNLPTNIAPQGELWTVSGIHVSKTSFTAGALEWCKDEEDALRVLRSMQHDHTYYDLRALRVQNFSKLRGASKDAGKATQVSGHKTKQQRRDEAALRAARGIFTNYRFIRLCHEFLTHLGALSKPQYFVPLRLGEEDTSADPYVGVMNTTVKEIDQMALKAGMFRKVTDLFSMAAHDWDAVRKYFYGMLIAMRPLVTVEVNTGSIKVAWCVDSLPERFDQTEQMRRQSFERVGLPDFPIPFELTNKF
jgi:hypothetical protein